MGEQLAVGPGGEAAGTSDPPHASEEKEGRDRRAETCHPSQPRVPSRQRQSPASVKRHKCKASLHTGHELCSPTRPSASIDTRPTYPGSSTIFTKWVAVVCGGGMPGCLTGKEAFCPWRSELTRSLATILRLNNI